MKKIICGLILGILSLVAYGGITATVNAVSPVDVLAYKDPACGTLSDDQSCNDSGKSATSAAVPLVNVVIGILGVTCVIVIIIAGINYATANGDPGKASRATKAIIYAVVGLIVGILSWAIVSFVSNNV